APGAAAVPWRRVLGRSRRAPARSAAWYRRHRHLRRPADPVGRDSRRHDTSTGGGRGRGAGRRHRAADAPAAGGRRREHVVAGAAGRLPAGDLRVRRRSGGGRITDALGGRPGSAAWASPAGYSAARERRLGPAGGLGRPRLAGGSGPASGGARGLDAVAGPGGTLVGAHAGRSMTRWRVWRALERSAIPS